MRIALFISCLADTFHPRVGVAIVRVLEHLGHTVEFPPTQTCCGQPMVNSGFAAEARRAARHTIRTLASYETIVTPSASCCATIRVHYPRLFDPGTADHEAAVALGERTYEFVEMLEQVLGFDPGAHGARWEGTVACHESCHRREIGTMGSAARMLGRVEGVDVAPMTDDRQCCGFGGTFSLRFPEVSGSMAGEKARAVRATGASHLVCDDTGCTMNITGACRREGAAVPALSTAEIIAEALGLLEPAP
jgi:L-lactate dehydrogenase complex protein LldE